MYTRFMKAQSHVLIFHTGQAGRWKKPYQFIKFNNFNSEEQLGFVLLITYDYM